MSFKIKDVMPLFTGVITTARTYVGDQRADKGGLIVDTTKMAGTMNPIQQVFAVSKAGESLGLKKDSVVKLNFNRYYKTKQKPGAIEDNVQSSVLQGFYEFPIVEIGGVKYLSLQQSDIEYIITDYDIDEGGLFE